MRRGAEELLCTLEKRLKSEERAVTFTSEAQALSPMAKVSDRSAASFEAVLEMSRSVAGHDIDADTPLMEAGIDSLGAVELIEALRQRLEAG
eukprot:6758387-Prymnesium_polylepis.1